MACFEILIPEIETVVLQYNLSFCHVFITYVSPYMNNLNNFVTVCVRKYGMLLEHRNANANTFLLSYDKFTKK